jgi:hypothetical protein
MPVLDIFTAGLLWAMTTDGMLAKLLNPTANRVIASNLLFMKLSFSNSGWRVDA